MDHSLTSELLVDQHTSLCFAHTMLAPALFQLLQEESAYLSTSLPWVKFPSTLTEAQKMTWEQQLFNQGGQRITTYIRYQQALVGMIGFIRIDKKHHLGEMGYWLAEQHQGTGIMTNCCKRLLQYGFEYLELNRIELRINPENKRSMKIPQRLHFTHEGTMRQAILQNDTFQNLELFSLIREEYNTKFLF